MNTYILFYVLGQAVGVGQEQVLGCLYVGAGTTVVWCILVRKSGDKRSSKEQVLKNYLF